MLGLAKNKQQEDCVLFTIFDTKSGTYRDPILVPDQAAVIRALSTNFFNPANQYDQYVTHAEDFQLFKIGSFDRKTGLVSSYQPEHILNLHDLKSAALEKQRALSPT